jgi:hypothetical protein
VFSDAVVSVSVMREVRVVHIAALRPVPIFVVQVEKSAWPKSIVIHDEEVGENSSSLLDHTNLKIGKADQLLSHKSVELRVTRLPRHDV